MTIAEAHIEFEITVDKRSTSQVPEMPPEVIDYFLNEAYMRFVKTRYGKNNIYKAGFEEIQKRTDDLRSLVITESVDTIAVPYEADETAFPAVQLDIADLTTKYMFYVRGRAGIKRGNCPILWIKPKLVQQDDLEVVLEDPFNRPSSGIPLIYFENGNIIIRTDSNYTVPKFKVTFVKFPTPVNIGTYGVPVQQFEIADHTHKEIIQLAADIAIENIESQRGQTIKQQVSTIE